MRRTLSHIITITNYETELMFNKLVQGWFEKAEGNCYVPRQIIYSIIFLRDHNARIFKYLKQFSRISFSYKGKRNLLCRYFIDMLSECLIQAGIPASF